MQLEKEKLSLMKELRDIAKAASERDAEFQQELLVLKRAKLQVEARRLVMEEERLSQSGISVPLVLSDQQGDACFTMLKAFELD